jgi:hypothetical protein
MRKMTLQIMFFAAGLTGLASCCNGQSGNKTKTATGKEATCSHCGKTSCDKSCSSNSLTEKKEVTMPTPILPSCSLNEKELAERGNTLSKTIFSKVKMINSFKDGYDIVFTEPKEFSLDLIEMVNFERSCCSDFTWALVFEPNNKATHLQVYGSKKIKEEMRNAFKSFGLGHLIK